MISIKKARLEHFEEIYILLKQLDNKKISKDDWKNIFIDHFNSNENYFGYMLIVGLGSSMFTSIYVTKTIIMTYFKIKPFTKLII